MQDILERFNQIILDYKNNPASYQDIDDQTKENDDSDDLGDPIVQNEVQCFMSVFQDPKLAGLVPLEDLISTFEVLHIEELKPISSEHLSFELLD